MKSRAKYHRLWRKINPERARQHSKKYYKTHSQEKKEYYYQYSQKIKKEVFSHYSKGKPKCAICGFSDMRALNLDHINNDGYLERKNPKFKGQKIYRLIRKNGYPKHYQILCANCNLIKRVNIFRKTKSQNCGCGALSSERYERKTMKGAGVKGIKLCLMAQSVGIPAEPAPPINGGCVGSQRRNSSLMKRMAANSEVGCDNPDDTFAQGSPTNSRRRVNYQPPLLNSGGKDEAG